MIRNCLTKIRAHLIGSLCALLMVSCNIDDLPSFKNTYLPDYEGNIALLIVNDTISFSEFLEDNVTEENIYEIDSDQRIVFSYELNTDFNLADDFVEIDDFNNKKTIHSPIGVPFVAPKDTTISFTKKLVFNFPAADNEPLDSLYFSAGDFDFSIESTFPYPVSYQFSSAAFTNISTQDSILIISEIAASGSDSRLIDLAGYRTSLVSESDSNKFVVHLITSVELQSGASLAGDEYLDLNVDVVNSDFDLIFGSFGKDTFEMDQTKKNMSFFEDMGGKGILFESPTIEIAIENGFGVPFAIDLSNLYMTYEDADPMYATGSFAEQLQLISATSVENYGISETTTLMMDVNNSNLREMLEGSPSNLIIVPKGYTNYEEEVPNWLSSDSKIDVNAKISIPLKLQVNGFEYDETSELDDLSDLEGTENLILLINTINELPFDGEIDIYMLDEDEVEIDSLIGNVLFAAPTSYDSNGKVSEPATSRVEIELDADQIESLIEATDLRFIVRLNSYEGSEDEFVEVFADYDLQIKLGISGNVSVDLNGN